MLSRAKAGRAKLFMSGGSQAVRLPKEFRFEDQREVLIYRQGRRVILESEERAWSPEFLDLAGSAPDFPYPEEPPSAEPGPDFDE
jgi:antitoxin VapB